MLWKLTKVGLNNNCSDIFNCSSHEVKWILISTCFSIKDVRFGGNHSSFISITFFGRTFAGELPLLEIVSKFAEIKLFQGLTSLTLALKIGLRYRIRAVALNLFPGYSLGGKALAHSGIWSHFMLAVKLPWGGISSLHYVVNVPVNMKDWPT